MAYKKYSAAFHTNAPAGDYWLSEAEKFYAVGADCAMWLSLFMWADWGNS